MTACTQDAYIQQPAPDPISDIQEASSKRSEWFSGDLVGSCTSTREKIELTPEKPARDLSRAPEDGPRYSALLDRYGANSTSLTFVQGMPKGIIVEYVTSSDEVIRTPYDITGDYISIFIPARPGTEAKFDNLKKVTLCY